MCEPYGAVLRILMNFILKLRKTHRQYLNNIQDLAQPKSLANLGIMAKIFEHSTQKPALSPTYRPLNRSNGEIRLLKILPPVSSPGSDSKPLDLCEEPIRCELEYESLHVLAAKLSGKQESMNSILAYLLQDIPTMRANDLGTDTGALMDLVGSRLLSTLSVDKDTSHEIWPERIEALRKLYEMSRPRLERWFPEGIQLKQKSFENWLSSSSIWTPLSGDANHLEHESLSYFALSYVWKDQKKEALGHQHRQVDSMIEASGMTIRQAMEYIGSSQELIDEVCGEAGDVSGDFSEITIDGIPILIGQSLEKALRTLREIPEIANGTRIWVDALCINQSDVQEKNFEVKRMGEIYRYADRVVSYLGEEKDDSGDILELMDAIGEVMQQAQILAPITQGFIKNIQSDMAISMTRLLLRTYFSRIWIIQEIALGGEKSIVLCGARRFSWTNLLRCGKMLNAGFSASFWNLDARLNPSQGNDENEDYLTLADLKEGITKLQMLRDAQINSRKQDEDDKDYREVPRSNTLWFRIPSSNDATDPRDLIYGMMSLLPKKLIDLIDVDYAPSTGFADVMRKFAEAHITSTQSLQWITHRYYSPFLGHQEWPTWVPNLAQKFSSAHWAWTVNLEGGACPNIPCDPSFAMDRITKKHLLVCKAMKLDTIHMTTQNNVTDAVRQKTVLIETLAESMTTENADELYPIIENLQRSLYTQYSLIVPDEQVDDTHDSHSTSTSTVPVANTHKYGTIEGLKDAINKCFSRFDVKLEGGQSIFNFPLDISEEHFDAEVLTAMIASLELKPRTVTGFNMLRELFGDLQLWDTTFRDLFPPHVADVDPASFSSPAIETNAFSIAHLFTTTNGYVGTCLCNIKAGEELFLLPGCSLPVLLKESDSVAGSYELRGGVYIPGLMGGEALEGQDSWEDKFETILIC
jgi:hypothetical protein